MIILHVVKTENTKANGVSVAVDAYTKFEAIRNQVAVFNVSGYTTKNKIAVYDYKEYNCIKKLPCPFNTPDLVIFNEVYKFEYIALYKECKKNGLKYVIIPHGCLVRVAQSRKKIKKKMGNLLLFNKFLKNASAIQFLNENEKNESKKFKFNKIIISGNGIEIKIKEYNCPKSKKLIYIGRYSIYHKGIDYIIEIAKKYKKYFIENEIVFDLYGNNSVNSLEEIKAIVKKNNVDDIIFVNPPIFGKEKTKLLCEAYGFIQLSRFEGEPMGIIEALAYGLPCIITIGTNLSDFVIKNKCGYSSSDDIEKIFNNIKKLYSNTKNRNQMSKNAIISIRKKYNWELIIKKLEEEYKGL